MIIHDESTFITGQFAQLEAGDFPILTKQEEKAKAEKIRKQKENYEKSMENAKW